MEVCGVCVEIEFSGGQEEVEGVLPFAVWEEERALSSVSGAVVKDRREEEVTLVFPAWLLDAGKEKDGVECVRYRALAVDGDGNVVEVVSWRRVDGEEGGRRVEVAVEGGDLRSVGAGVGWPAMGGRVGVRGGEGGRVGVREWCVVDVGVGAWDRVASWWGVGVGVGVGVGDEVRVVASPYGVLCPGVFVSVVVRGGVAARGVLDVNLMPGGEGGVVMVRSGEEGGWVAVGVVAPPPLFDRGMGVGLFPWVSFASLVGRASRGGVGGGGVGGRQFAVVKVVCGEQYGSGIVVGGKEEEEGGEGGVVWVLTNAHVIGNRDGGDRVVRVCMYPFGGGGGGEVKVEGGEVVWAEEGVDAAWIPVTGKDAQRVVSWVRDRGLGVVQMDEWGRVEGRVEGAVEGRVVVEMGDEILVGGYPVEEPLGAGDLGGEGPVWTSGVVTSVVRGEDGEDGLYCVDAAIHSGNSGGLAVSRASGRPIGVVTSNLTSESLGTHVRFGFVLPLARASPRQPRREEGGRVGRAWELDVNLWSRGSKL